MLLLVSLHNISDKINHEIENDQFQKKNAYQMALNDVQTFVRKNCEQAQPLDVSQFETQLLKLLIVVGLRALQYLFAMKRTIPTKRRLMGSDGRFYKYVKEKCYPLRSIFGEATYWASQYCRGESRASRKEINSIASEVGLLPAGGLSPNLGLEVVNLCRLMAYEKAQEVLQLFRAYVPSKRSICGIIDLLGQHAEQILDDTPCEGGEVAMIQVDARSAPQIRKTEYKKRCQPHKKRVNRRNRKGRKRCVKVQHTTTKKRRTRGQKSKKNKQITVGLIYTLNRMDDGTWEGPYGKFFARFGSAEAVFKRLKATLDAMGDTVKTVVFLSDGAPHYRNLQLKYFPQAIAAIDFYHVTEYLWKAGETIYEEGSDALEEFVAHLKTMLLEGEIHEVLSILQSKKETIAQKGPGTKGRRKRMSDSINYISKRVEQMPYKELREKGLEIGSGAIEGAVRQIVAIRFDGPGMRWGEHRAQLLLHLICLHLSGGWNAFIKTIIDWAHKPHFQRRMTPIGINEGAAKNNSCIDKHDKKEDRPSLS